MEIGLFNRPLVFLRISLRYNCLYILPFLRNYHLLSIRSLHDGENNGTVLPVEYDSRTNSLRQARLSECRN